MMHPHGPEIREALNGDGYCIWCFNLDERDAALSEIEALQRRVAELEAALEAIRGRAKVITAWSRTLEAWAAALTPTESEAT